MAANSSSYGASALKSSGPSISMVDNMGSIGIGNYKGVMLCNRPFGGTVGESKSAENNYLYCLKLNSPSKHAASIQLQKYQLLVPAENQHFSAEWYQNVLD